MQTPHQTTPLAQAVNSQRNPVLWLRNPFDTADVDISPAKSGQTIQQWLDENGGLDRLNQRPTVCVYQGRELMRAEYADHVIQSPVCFVTLPQGGGDGGSNPIAMVAMIALTVYAGPMATSFGYGTMGTAAVQAGIMMAGSMLINAMFPPPGPPESAQPSSASPTYSIAAQGNTARLGAPIPVNYGRMRIYPDFAAQPYTEFHGNEQFLYQLFSIGVGENSVSDVRFEDTLVSKFPDVEIEIVQPFQKVTLFPSAVITAPEAGGQNLNDPGILGPYRVNSIGTECARVGVDIVFPAGLIGMNEEGHEYSVEVRVRITAEPVDDGGSVTGNAIVIADQTITRRSRTPQRVTFSKSVPPAMYQVKIQRFTASGTSREARNMQLGSVRGYLVSDDNYGDVTLLAMRVRATDNITNTASRKVNCLYERLLPVWSQSGWSAPQVTRNPAWCFADAVRARYGGDFADSVLDLHELVNMAHVFDTRGDEFNGRFDSDSNLWEALSKIGQVVRSAPIRQGNMIRMVRDQKQLLPVAQFGMSKMKNLSMDFVMHNQRTADSVKILYWDQDKDYKQQTVICQLPGDNANNPREVTLFGVTDRAQAYREGMYLAATNKLRRQPVSWETEMDGYIPSFGDVVLLNHDLLDPQNMASGQVVDVRPGQELILSRDVDLPDDESWYVSLTDLYGAPVGPLRVVMGGQPNSVRVQDIFPPDFTVVTSADDERTHFILGKGSNWCRRVKITGITPQGDDIVQISGVVEDDIVHDIDNGVVPPPLPDYGLPSLAPGKVTNILITQGGTVAAPVLNISWDGQANVERYHIEVSTDGRATWQPAGTGVAYGPAFSFAAEPGLQTIRIAGVNAVRGEWEYEDVDAGSAFDVPAKVNVELTEPFVGDALHVQWTEDPAAARYLIEVWSGGSLKRTLYHARGLTTYSYHHLDAQQDGASRALTVKVRAENANGRQGPWGELSATNPPPAVPNNVQAGGLLNQLLVTMSAPTDTDIKAVFVWASLTKGFTPSPDNLLAISQGTNITIPVSPDTTWYVRAAFVDVWGEDGLNISGEQTAVTELITETEIMDDSISTPKLKANSVTTDKMLVGELSAISANMGEVTGGTFKTDAITGPRVVTTSEGNFPIWVGEGTVTAANGVMYYDKSQKRLFSRRMKATDMEAENLTVNQGTFRNVDVTGNVRANSLEANTANIVKTLHLQGQAVTIPLSAFSPGNSGGFSSGWTTIQTITYNSTGAPAMVSAATTAAWNGQGANYSQIRVLVNGTAVYTGPVLMSPGYIFSGGSAFSDTYHHHQRLVTGGSGTRKIELQIRTASHSTGKTLQSRNTILTLLETKR
ncbi:host specificity factor TipJ family phage tail protein [Sansalvadorimonas verongulae]|uniref:host specificity factor TipJ family phage tail protein n=1 Tax=Sansalvadorimonas verongulae TaxID=2172824 RepID=UPI0018AD172B|nr:host specificity factor TipJ family phage tail protein [Sansalvadorimonas verongulae]